MTQFQCKKEILERTQCLGNLIKSQPVKLQFLKEKNVSEVCEEFDATIITLDQETDIRGIFHQVVSVDYIVIYKVMQQSTLSSLWTGKTGL